MMNRPYWGPDGARVYFRIFDLLERSDVVASVPRFGGSPPRTEVDLLPVRRTSALFWGFSGGGGVHHQSLGPGSNVGTAPRHCGG